ncbi:membrane protein, putative [Pseudooceanicola batsensis HTCC2597]|uniref:Membrane protein, putative n=1 Tax=Pseudooceanicola batsensis (strain ATCC BAA-863 / DSM 15984 / KCTC 12145 / HTCC2597) TaxID=252305 RepID=A3TUM4_PSEBH|nr:DMT family transporter [Pseudooceanicola batsensis]EAQ04220.1 membrane protein, putative [Pseudooceanicola batsensis HTCC2597]
MTADRPLLGIALMLGFCFTAPLGDATAKYLGQAAFAQPVFQVVLLRFLMQALFLIPIAVATGRTLRMSPRISGFVFLRTVLHVLGVGLMFLSLRFLPLAETIAIAFVMPFILLLLGWSLMGEEVGWRRLAACAVGFLGTLLVIQPSFADVGWPALLPLGVALNFALFMLVTRRIAKETDPIAMQGVSGAMAMAVLLPLAALGWATGSETLSLAPIPQEAIGFYILLGLLGSFGHLLMTWSLRFAPSATLAPMQYLEIPFATLIGWLAFSDLPNGLAAVGIVITMGAGLYVILRERAIARQTVTVPQAAGGGPGAAV